MDNLDVSDWRASTFDSLVESTTMYKHQKEHQKIFNPKRERIIFTTHNSSEEKRNPKGEKRTYLHSNNHRTTFHQRRLSTSLKPHCYQKLPINSRPSLRRQANNGQHAPLGRYLPPRHKPQLIHRPINAIANWNPDHRATSPQQTLQRCSTTKPWIVPPNTYIMAPPTT